MDRVRRAIAGGLAGTTVMAVTFLIGEAEARFELGIPAAVARYAQFPEAPAIALIVFLLAGILLWPLGFVLFDQYVGERISPDPAVKGIAYAIPLWVLFVVLGTGGELTYATGLYLVFTFFGHVLYGFTLGAVYESLAPVSTA